MRKKKKSKLLLYILIPVVLIALGSLFYFGVFQTAFETKDYYVSDISCNIKQDCIDYLNNNGYELSQSNEARCNLNLCEFYDPNPKVNEVEDVAKNEI